LSSFGMVWAKWLPNRSKTGPFDNRTRIEFDKTGWFGFRMLTVNTLGF
jgi:hypothetical protein